MTTTSTQAFLSSSSEDITDQEMPMASVNLGTYAFPACLNTTSDAGCIAMYRPPLRHDFEFTVFMTLIYATLCVFGVFGNVLVIIVVSRMREMRTGANLYLLNLACADLMLVLTGLPLELQEYWFAYPHAGGPFLGPFLCIFRHWASEACAYACVLTICAFTFERACIVHWPTLLSSSRSANYRRVSVAIGVVWLLAGCFAALVSYQWRIDYVVSPDGRPLFESAICMPLEELNSPVLFIVPVVLFFFVPMGLITLLYMMIWRAIKQMSYLMRYGDLSSSAASSLRQQGSLVINAASSSSAQQQQAGQIPAAAIGDCSPVRQQQQHIHGQRGGSEQLLSSQHNKSFTQMMMEQNRQIDRRTTTVIQVQSAVTISFFVCWAPFHCQRLLVTFGRPEQWTENELKLYHVFNAIAGILYYLEATINPAIYSLLSQKFRRAFQLTLTEAANAKTCFQYIRLPRKIIMARLDRSAFHNVGVIVPRPPTAMMMVRQNLLMVNNIDSFEQQQQQPVVVRSPIINPGGLGGINSPAVIIRDDGANKDGRNQRQLEMAELCPANNGGFPSLSAISSHDEIVDCQPPKKRVASQRNLFASAVSSRQPAGGSNNLCQFCKHSPRHSLSMIPSPSTANVGNSDGSKSSNNNAVVGRKMDLLGNNVNNIILRRNSDQPSVRLSQIVREALLREASVNKAAITPSSSVFFTGMMASNKSDDAISKVLVKKGDREAKCNNKTLMVSSTSLFVDSNIAVPSRSAPVLPTSSSASLATPEEINKKDNKSDGDDDGDETPVIIC